jgi:hypothetical protein
MGTPIRLVFRERASVDDPGRRSRGKRAVARNGRSARTSRPGKAAGTSAGKATGSGRRS